MPVILTTQAEVETWLTASTKDALALQRPLADGALKIIARGEANALPCPAMSTAIPCMDRRM